MKPKILPLDRKLYDYLLARRTPDDPVLVELREETARLGDRARMQIAPEQGTFLRMLVAAIGARRAVEVGTFTGYSAICIARGLAPGGRLLCCDVSAEWTAVARRYWEKAGVADRIDLRLAPAVETLRALSVEPVVDFAFIDADKTSYPVYYEEILRRLRPGGLIAVDNVLWSGDVVRPQKRDADTRAIRRFNDLVAADERVDSVMTPIADGITLVRKRG
ncbi:MAG: SAM-dependent methyltransferase [Acidobacteria bacterium]|nr:MAG: SAM-dependent methyltransferase [Acidobacteriota bacterium]